MQYEISRDWQDLNILTGIEVGSSAYITNTGRSGDIVEITQSNLMPTEKTSGYPIAMGKSYSIIGQGRFWIRFVRHESPRKPSTTANIVDVQDAQESSDIPADLVNPSPLWYRRLKVESEPLSVRYIEDGRGTYLEWFNSGLASGSSSYVRFTVPSDKVMILDSRLLIPEREKVKYRVYATGYTVTGVVPESDQEHFILGNLRIGTTSPSLPVELVTVSAEPSIRDRVLQVNAYGSTGAGNRASGSISSDNIVRIIPPDSEFLLQVENEGSDTTEFQVDLVFFFLPPDFIYPAQV